MKVALFILLGLSACRRHGDDRASLYGPWHAPPTSEIVSPVNSRSEYQLLGGFLPADSSPYRWTQLRFALLLAAPAIPASVVELNGYAPEIPNRPNLTLQCSLNDQPLAPATIPRGRPFTQRWPAPPSGATAVLECAVQEQARHGVIEVGLALFRAAILPP